ncbi:MAG: TetR/AcrR family transcriptional regulator [Erythrobacter sp.]|nr:TetR/AcrR family transcriptional regulator [Erythrobacter sp.]MBA4080229.1 TetR/AcrR family transcriptional regulator [Erythrobacter sp.]
MSSQRLSRDVLLPLLMEHVLTHGLGQASLRPLAKAAGTSDRMLIYHFGSKERLISELLTFAASVYAAGLEAVITTDAHPPTRADLLARILEQNAGPASQPFKNLWWEIVGGAARDLPGYREAARGMMHELLGWLERNMPPGDPDPAGGARFLLTVIEGTMMLSAVGHEDTAHAGLLAGGLLPS